MKRRSVKNGFTLVEILIAVAIIAAIISMVYGSYFAASKSAQACETRIALSQQGRTLLEQMAQQIRCCYTGSVKEHKYPDREASQKKEITPEQIISYFTGDSGEMGGEILYFVTTNGISEEQAAEDGLFEVVYKFDKHSNTLFFSQERFLNAPLSVAEKRNWQPVAENIESIELAFSDGQQWLQSWDFKEKRGLPVAVKINITSEDENYRQYHYGTTAYVCCGKNESKKTISETLVSMNK
ncbi:MAG: type II secretion system protein GspJ [Planctomycetota bacterium]